MQSLENRLATLDAENFLTLLARLIHALEGCGVNVDDLFVDLERVEDTADAKPDSLGIPPTPSSGNDTSGGSD